MNAARQLSLNPPVFLTSERKGKCISGKRLENDLQITHRQLDLIH
jgi:hypothetical protein